MQAVEYSQFIDSKRLVDIDSGFDIDESFLNPKLFPFQKAIVRWALNKGRAAIFADCGLGKGQPYGSLVLTPEGCKKIEELGLSDRVFARDGKDYKLLGIYPKAEIPTYRFYYSDGTSAVFDIEHLHFCRTNNDRQRGKDWRVLSTSEILNDYPIRYGNDGKSRNLDVPVVQPINFPESQLLIHPYIVGVLLGDGHLSGNVSISSGDAEIVDLVQSLLPRGLWLKKKGLYEYRIMTGLTGTRKHPFRSHLDELGLLGLRSHNKFIPKTYLFSSVEQRLWLLRGLLDTDGYIRDTCQYYSTSEQLADDVRFLLQSLGCCPTKSVKKTPKRDCHTLTFSMKGANPFLLARKAENLKDQPTLIAGMGA